MRRARGGTTAIEFALVLPLLLTLTAGILEASMYLHTRFVVVEAARAGARAASVEYDATALTSTARTTALARLTAFGQSTTGVSVGVSRVSTSGDVIQVSVSAPYRPLIGLTPAPSTIVAHASAQYEDPAN